MASICDNRDNLNRFLFYIGGTKLKRSPNARQMRAAEHQARNSSAARNPDDATGIKPESTESTHVPGHTVDSVEAGPTAGSRAPPSTPETYAVTARQGTRLKPIQEDGGRTVLAPKNPNISTEMYGSYSVGLTPTQAKLLRKKQASLDMEQEPDQLTREMSAQEYMDTVVERFRKEQAEMLAQEVAVGTEHGAGVKEDATSVEETSDTVPFPAFNDTGISQHGSLKSDTAEFGAVITSKAQSAEEGLAEMTIAANGSSVLSEAAVSPTILVTTSSEADGCVKCNSEEQSINDEQDREHLTHFESWGTPTKRNKPAPRVRTVILHGLPRSADLTLVQSLIHGGSIEEMRLFAVTSESSTIKASVTFTSGDACEKYFHAYPNGIGIRHRGKKYDVLVEKGESIDLVSSMMQGYLDCAASRVVKMTGADDDWGIVALNKLAEGKNHVRQVEAVTDRYHNGTRTVLFRFAKISDAVNFRSALIRSHDWEGCPIEFTEDPCEKATGVHDD